MLALASMRTGRGRFSHRSLSQKRHSPWKVRAQSEGVDAHGREHAAESLKWTVDAFVREHDAKKRYLLPVLLAFRRPGDATAAIEGRREKQRFVVSKPYPRLPSNEVINKVKTELSARSEAEVGDSWGS